MRLGLNSLRQRWDTLTPRARGIIIVAFIALLFIALPLILYSQNLIYSGTINLKFAPKSATAKIGTSSAQFGDNKVHPGTYTVTISKQGFATYTEKVTVNNGQTVSVATALVSNDPSTADWYQTHTDDYSIAQDIGDDAADQAHVTMKKEFPIAQVLPIVGLYSTYRVDYGKSPTKTGKYAVYISYQTEADKQKAIQVVKDKGYELSEYEVVYTQDAPSGQGVTIEGLSSFSEKGLSGDAVASLQDALETHYTNYQGKADHTLIFGDAATHTISDDKTTATYINTLTIDGGSTISVKIVATDYDHLVITFDNTEVFNGRAGQTANDNTGD
jgi:FlaG/FlaF family flagellin (archaellin)